jgi:hypothetical protein
MSRVKTILPALGLLVLSASSTSAQEYLVGGPMSLLPGQHALCSVTNLHPTEEASVLLEYYTRTCTPLEEYSRILAPGDSTDAFLFGDTVFFTNVVCVLSISPKDGKKRFKNLLQGTMTVLDDKSVPLASVPLQYHKQPHPCLAQ